MVLAFALVIPDGGVRELWDRTVGFQLGRDSPFSIWGQEDGLGWLQSSSKAARCCWPQRSSSCRRSKTALQVAALGAAVLIAVQLSLSHWFYLYIVWWLPAGADRAAGQPALAPLSRNHHLLERSREPVLARLDQRAHHPYVVGRPSRT